MACDDKRQIVVNVDAGVHMTIKECGLQLKMRKGEYFTVLSILRDYVRDQL